MPGGERVRQRVPHRAAAAGREAVRDRRGDERDQEDDHRQGALQEWLNEGAQVSPPQLESCKFSTIKHVVKSQLWKCFTRSFFWAVTGPSGPVFRSRIPLWVIHGPMARQNQTGPFIFSRLGLVIQPKPGGSLNKMPCTFLK